MDQLEFNSQPTQHYTVSPQISEVNRDDRPSTPNEVSPFNLGNQPAAVYYAERGYTDPYATPLPSPLFPLLLGIAIVYIYKICKNKVPILVANLKKKH